MTRNETIGRYRLLAEIASGGMGSVYLARDERVPSFEKLVALKQIHKHLADDERFVTMFLDEARIASLVRHANVCGVEDFGEADSTYYLTMEYLVGEPLARVIRAHGKRVADGAADARGPRFFAVAARLLADACEGLHAAHELRDARGEPLELVHRDISPPNLFVGYDGVIRVLDFGVAKTARRLAETTVGGIKGKFAYMAPEQLRRGPLDRRADVWALGVVAWELLAGQRLFRRETELETMEAILSHPIPLASEIAPDVPAELDAIVQRALTRDRDARYASARDMGRDLTRYLAECGLPAGLADVAEWMGQLFPTGAADKIAFVERALAATAPEPHTDPRVDADTQAATMPELAPAKRPPSRARWAVLGAIAILGLAGGAWVMTMASRPAQPAVIAHEERATSAIAAAPSEPVADAPPDQDDRESEPEHVATAPAPPAREEAPRERHAPRVRRRGRAPREENASTPLPASTAPGMVQVVTTSGWARVSLHGRELGTTPLRTSLPAGDHALELRTEDGRTRRITAHVRAGEVARVVVDLQH